MKSIPRRALIAILACLLTLFAATDVVSAQKGPGLTPTPPTLPPSPQRTCRRHQDCVLLPGRTPDDSCHCAPCGQVWRRSVNRTRYQQLRRRWARLGPCAPNFPCPRCRTQYLGLVARCIARQCQVRTPHPKPLRSFETIDENEVYRIRIVKTATGWTNAEPIRMPYHHATRIVWTNIGEFPTLERAKIGARATILAELTKKSTTPVPSRRQWRTEVFLRIVQLVP